MNNGTVATANAATPDATPECSARVTPPLPQANSRKPIIAAERHCTHVGAGDPRQRMNAYIKLPATRKRTPAIISGGQDSMPIRITR